MKFRPCIDIHNGKVKQIVGGSLLDQGDQAVEAAVNQKSGQHHKAEQRRDHRLQAELHAG